MNHAITCKLSLLVALWVSIKHNEKPVIKQKQARRKTMMTKIKKPFMAYGFWKRKPLMFFELEILNAC